MCPALTADEEPSCASKIPSQHMISSPNKTLPPSELTLSLQHTGPLVAIDAGTASQRQKLRAKTGCLTCKSRRKKCDEKTPVCNRCLLSGRPCTWPKSNELTDRRYASHPKSRHGAGTALCMRSEKAACNEVTYNLEVVISRHFVDQYYNLLLLPGCHPDFRDGWINEIQDLMVSEKSLHYSMLTNAASHIYNIDNAVGMQHLALEYYSKALRGLKYTLERPKSSPLVNHNGLLMTVMLLYLHGCMGRGTFLDIPPHLSAAMNILKLRLLEVPLKITRPFDYLAVESVLYQMFLVITGLWTQQTPLQGFNMQFWIQAENLLARSVMFPGHSRLANSPVLGIPASLYRLVVQAKLMLQHPISVTLKGLNILRNEIEVWEQFALRRQNLLGSDEKDLQQQYVESATYLCALIVSLLLEQIMARLATNVLELTTEPNAEFELAPDSVSGDKWQIRKAVEIMRRYETDDGWAKCYIGNWPVYTIGFFFREPDHIGLVRENMKRRWELTKFSQILRFQNDLKSVWASRDQLPTAVALPCHMKYDSSDSKEE